MSTAAVSNLQSLNAQYEALDHLALDMVLPWQEQAEQQEKFKQLLKKICIPFFAFMLVMTFMPNFNEEEVAEKVVAQVILEAPELKPVEQPPAEAQKRKTQSINKQAKPKAGTKNGAQSMAALAKQMSAMRQSVNTSKAQKKNVFKASSGKVQKSSRAMLGTNKITQSSGGLKASDLTVNAKGASLAEHKSDEVESSIANIELPSAAQYHYDPKKNSKRDMQSVRRTIERYKGAVYSLYSKALRSNPELSGRFVFEFVILPSGKIDTLKLKSSELGDNALEKRMLSKIKAINFGTEEVNATAVQYTFTFLPS